MSEYNKGKLTDEERKYIVDNMDTTPYKDIAEKIKRNPKRIKLLIRKMGSKPVEKVNAYTFNEDIKKSVFWKELQLQFDRDELRMFKFHWDDLVSQFEKDILPTEERQIVSYIKMEILVDRVLRQKKYNLDQIAELDYKISEEKKLMTPNEERIGMWRDQLQLLMNSCNSIVREIKDLEERKSKILGDMKGTRNQRIKELEKSGETLMGWIKTIMTDKKVQTEVGLYAEKMRLAMEATDKKLREYHKYADGGIDKPILTVD